MRRLCQIVILALFVWEVTSDCVNQDTATFDSDCHTNPRFAPEHVYPTNWGLMLDSHDFQNLVADTNPAWELLDVDGDGGQVTIDGCIVVCVEHFYQDQMMTCSAPQI